ncbi:MAG: hypothetical protein EOO15_15820 [Chitinophagaceae bacterium]|nr:MAG: hypothetical protein EOO15_15820 [Chitinophagaceae bacterium]
MRKILTVVFISSGLLALATAIVLFFFRDKEFDRGLFLWLYLPLPILTIVSIRAYFFRIKPDVLRIPLRSLLIGISALLFLMQLVFSMFLFAPIFGGSPMSLELRLLGYFFFVGAVLNFSVLYRLCAPTKNLRQS